MSDLEVYVKAGVEVEPDMELEHMNAAQFRHLRARSRSRDVDQGHESLW